MRALATGAGTQQVLKCSYYVLDLFSDADGGGEGHMRVVFWWRC